LRRVALRPHPASSPATINPTIHPAMSLSFIDTCLTSRNRKALASADVLGDGKLVATMLATMIRR